MQLVLLSGGSGMRLWPLSNNARSKQFLPLLEREDGLMESMLQRVMRQFLASGIKADITLTTNAAQRDMAVNQLGESITVVTEPERNGTFAAISLAASHLSMVKGCSDDEVVVIMPCDPYTEPGYYETIAKMARAVEANAADFVLMGILPTYPSAKYGYIVPEGEACGTWRRVSKFVEKPCVADAEQLVSQGAFWNGGVFAFKLGRMMRVVREYVNESTFEAVRSRFSEFPHNSFDYEVAEKVSPLAVVPYLGAWKDLGTWNTLTDELHQHVIGNAMVGPTCENTHVINELMYPVFVDGLKDVVVAACPDGILVCAKKETENIKKYVGALSHRPMYEERRWGTYRVIDETVYSDGFKSLTKSLTLKVGKNISYQLHHHRTEVWTFVDGEGLFVLDGETRRIRRGDTVVIPVGHLHAVKALSDLTFIEVQTGNPLVEEDIERFDWTWPE